MPKSHKICFLFSSVLFLLGFLASLAFATQDVRVVGSASIKNAPNSQLSVATTTVKIIDANGNSIGGSQSAAGDWHLNVSVEQAVIDDSNNSSDTPLTALSVFTGTKTVTTGVAGIQVSLKTDTNCHVKVEQSRDGINWDISDEYNYYASIGNFGITVQAVQFYVRVIVENVQNIDQTYLRLGTALCPIVESLPRSLDSHGHLQVHSFGFEDEYGFEAENTPAGDQRAVTPVLLAGNQFEGSVIDSVFWTSSTTNNASITASGATAVLRSSITANGSATLYSVRRARYVGGAANVFRGDIRLDATADNNVRRWGAATGTSLPTVTDGAWFEVNGTTFSIVTMIGGSSTTVTSGFFNGDLGGTYSPGTNVLVYEIYWTNNIVYFTVDGKILHKVETTNSHWTNFVSLNAYLSNFNINDGTADTNLFVRSATIRRLGPLLTQPISAFQSGTVASRVLKSGSGNIHSAIISNVTQNAVLTLYDGLTTSGTTIWSSGAMGSQTIPLSIDFKGIPFATGLTLAITGANCNAFVAYE